MPPFLESILVGVSVGIVSAGATAGIALRRRRSETAFDRRLKWCEEALGAFHQAGAALISARDADPNDRELSEDCWTRTVECYEKLIPLCGQKELYASSEGVRAIAQFMEALWALIDEHLQGHAGGSARSCDTCLAKLQDAGLAMSMEARKHLNLDPLPARQLKADTKFFGSFKGRRLHGHRMA